MARQPTQVQVLARDTGDRIQAPTSNPALELASALESVEPSVKQFTQRYAADQRAKAQTQARIAALASSGEKFADAVRNGQIAPTQNPWFLMAYENQSAQVQSQRRLATLQEKSTQWEERSDSAAFQERLSREIGEIGKDFSGNEMAQEGFLVQANQTQQQLSATNTARNAARIAAERETNASVLASEAILQANAANGGNVTGAQVAAALEVSKAEYLATGGAESEWEGVLVAAVTTAATNAGDPDLLNVLKDDALGNPYANPEVAGNVENSAYRIRQGVIDRIQFQEQQQRAQAQAEGNEFATYLFDTYGEKMLTGQFDPVAISREGRERGVSFQGIASAMGSFQRDVSNTQSLQRARLQSASLDPARGTAIANLFRRADTEGNTPAFQADLQAAYLNGDLPTDDYIRLEGAARSTSEGPATRGGGSGSRSSGGSGGSRPSSGGGGTVRNITGLRTQVEALGVAAWGVANTGLPAGTRRVGSAEAAEEVIMAAAQGWLATHPGDFQGAHERAQYQARRWGEAMRRRAQSGAPSARPPASQPSGGRNSGDNPLRVAGD